MITKHSTANYKEKGDSKMKTRLLVAFMLISLLAGMLAAVPVRMVAAAGNATLSIKPASVSRGPANIDSFFDVYLEVDTDKGIAGLGRRHVDQPRQYNFVG
jgi:hypothetical protein